MKDEDRESDKSSTSTRSRVGRTLAWLPWQLAFIAVVFIFVPHDAVERAWPAAVDPDSLRVAKIAFSLILAAFAAVWFVLRAAPPAAATQTGPSFPVLETAEHYVPWFIAVRWRAVVAGLLACLAATANEVLPGDVCLLLLLTLAGLAGCNAGFAILARNPAWRPSLLWMQVYADLVALTIVLHFSGGIENPLSLSILIHVVLAGILLSRWQCYGVAAAASVMFMLMAWGEWSGLLHHYFVPTFPHGDAGWKDDAAQNTLYVAGATSLQSALFFFVAYIVTTLVARTRSQEHRLRALAEAAYSERRLLEQALQTTHTAVRVVGPQLRPRWMNERWREWFGSGHARDTILSRDSTRLGSMFTTPVGPSDDGLRVAELALPAAPDGAAELSQGDRQERIFRVTTAPLIDENGHVEEVAELAQEITAERRAEAQMLRAAKMAAVGELAGRVAHEVNNPIAIISAKARLLLGDHRDGMSSKTIQEIGKIVELADRVARIAQGLLSYGRPSVARRMPLDIRAPIRNALSMVEQRAQSSGVRIEDRLGSSVLHVNANSSEIEQVFLNLFLNALDAMPDGGELSVATAANERRDSKPEIGVVVADTGTGIPEAILGEIFEPFFTTKEQRRGTGLGLAICLGIIRNHGGTIDVDSEAGKGTRFTLRLPAMVVEKEAEATCD